MESRILQNRLNRLNHFLILDLCTLIIEEQWRERRFAFFPLFEGLFKFLFAIA